MLNNLSKRGQVTIFIIIGVILVIVSAFLFFSGNIKVFESHEEKLKNQVSDVVVSCIEEYAQKGTFLLGFQGGVIDIPQQVKANPRKYIDLGLKMPNWDTQTQDVPTIYSMEKQLNSHIEQSAFICIENNLKALNENILTDIKGELVVNSKIQKEKVIVEANLPISLKEKNKQDVMSLQDYYVTLDKVRLGSLFELAQEIYKLENRDYFLEELVIEQIMSASDYSDVKYSMPSEGMLFSCTPSIWTKTELKKILSRMNNNNFKYIQFVGTYQDDNFKNLHLNEEYGNQGYRAYFENPNTGYVQELINPQDAFRDYKVEIFMPSSEVTGNSGYFQSYPFREFDVTPSSGEVVKSMKLDVDAGIKIPIPCVQIYHHLYDLDYDLMVKLTDKNDDGENFFFQFPIRVLIEDNTAKSRPFSFFEMENSNYNSQTFCSIENMKYPMRVSASDVNTGTFLNDVNISYDCVGLNCQVGKTQRLSFKGIEYGNNAVLSADFPFCIGGGLSAQKEGYHTGFLKVDRTDESLLLRSNPVYYNVEMIPTVSFKTDRNSFLVESIDNEKFGNYYSIRLSNQDDGFIYIGIENKGLKFNSEVIWPREYDLLSEIEFLDGDYEYNLTMVYVDGEGNLKGMYEALNWKPDINDIKASNTIEFKIPGKPSGIDEDNFEEYYEKITHIAQTGVNPHFFGVNFR